MSLTDESATVNPPDELDSVLHRLRRQFDCLGLRLDGPPKRLSGGFWAEMWILTFAADGGRPPNRAVLRLAPDARHSAWETTIQAGVAAQGYPTPQIHASDTAHEGLRAWSVMAFAEGRPLLAGLKGMRALATLPRLATDLPDTLARAAADLHRLDPAPIEADLGGRAGIDAILDGYLDRTLALADAPLRRTVEWLAGNRPDERPTVVCHGDLHPFNVLSDGHRHVVVDWTAAQITHPAYDLAFTQLLLSHPPLAAPGPLRPVIGAAGRRVANRFLATYRQIAPYPIDSNTLNWYRQLQACRILVDIAEWRADATTDDHRGHPWFAIEPALRPLLTAR